jgi:two-component system cell cycle response regulator CpdR
MIPAGLRRRDVRGWADLPQALPAPSAIARKEAQLKGLASSAADMLTIASGLPPILTTSLTGVGIPMARILLAEDDDSLREFLAKALRRAGHWVEAAPDGSEAESQLDGNVFDLLLADVVMPGLDGIELARRASARDPELKVLFITGFAAVALRQRDGLPGAPRVLSKPFHLRDLVAEVDSILAA